MLNLPYRLPSDRREASKASTKNFANAPAAAISGLPDTRQRKSSAAGYGNDLAIEDHSSLEQDKIFEDLFADCAALDGIDLTTEKSRRGEEKRLHLLVEIKKIRMRAAMT
ncbi:hypothetical protein BUALT_Bualt06G0121400 [Buddleja alternifolia]|uniref:Uncharacterized protein n=1 Tax=Buddleja alternifolia TaxID=168488 RepID=A0AAV6XLC3_9LAMI|nr:hypothetical protein BUALT_Bualt06G0121400 [Buddleja alternifolia]